MQVEPADGVLAPCAGPVGSDGRGAQRLPASR